MVDVPAADSDFGGQSAAGPGAGSPFGAAGPRIRGRGAFVVTNFALASYDGGPPADCPDGAFNIQRPKDIYLQSPAAGRARTDEQARGGEGIVKAPLCARRQFSAPGLSATHNRCADPQDFESPPLRTVQGHVRRRHGPEAAAAGGSLLS